jgi:murein DD-endopeptidase MepM/ murein hydrolase activator NlpD
MRRFSFFRLVLPVFLFSLLVADGQPFALPTANTNLFNTGNEAAFFTATSNPSIDPEWMSGAFGCVRNSRTKIHEGIDIKAQVRDRGKEPIDDVLAIGDGVVMYVNSVAGNSSYGKYILVGHRVDGLDVVSVYAHLREIGNGVRAGLKVKRGQRIATLGRTSNTRSGISRDRAHLHLEIGLFMNQKYPEWYQKTSPGARNEHGMFSGLNLSGLDPRELFLEQRIQGARFNLVEFIRSRPELCRVQVRKKRFEFADRYRALIEHNPDVERQGVAGYEVVLSYVGTPIRLIPLTESQLKSPKPVFLVSVNEEVQKQNRCRNLVTRDRSGWKLATNGEKVISLMTY